MSASSENIYNFTAIPLESAFPNSLSLEDIQSYLSKWDVLSHLKIGKFRFDAPIDVKNTPHVEAFIASLFSSPVFLHDACSLISQPSENLQITGIDTTKPINYTLLPATITSMSVLDRLVDHKVVSKDYDCHKAETLISKTKISSNTSKFGPLASTTSLSSSLSSLKLTSSVLSRATGRIAQCPEDVVDNLVLSDLLRQALFNPAHELYALYSSQERAELFLRLLSVCVGGGELGQSEEALGAYAEVAKRICMCIGYVVCICVIAIYETNESRLGITHT